MECLPGRAGIFEKRHMQYKVIFSQANADDIQVNILKAINPGASDDDLNTAVQAIMTAGNTTAAQAAQVVANDDSSDDWVLEFVLPAPGGFLLIFEKQGD